MPFNFIYDLEKQSFPDGCFSVIPSTSNPGKFLSVSGTFSFGFVNISCGFGLENALSFSYENEYHCNCKTHFARL